MGPAAAMAGATALSDGPLSPRATKSRSRTASTRWMRALRVWQCISATNSMAGGGARETSTARDHERHSPSAAAGTAPLAAADHGTSPPLPLQLTTLLHHAETRAAAASRGQQSLRQPRQPLQPLQLQLLLQLLLLRSPRAKQHKMQICIRESQ